VRAYMRMLEEMVTKATLPSNIYILKTPMFQSSRLRVDLSNTLISKPSCFLAKLAQRECIEINVTVQKNSLFFLAVQ